MHAVGAPSPRTYVIDPGLKAIYRADPFMIANLCMPEGRCDVEITPSRVTALMSMPFEGAETKISQETRFVLDREKGELRTTDVIKAIIDGQPSDPSTTEGTYTCVTVSVPDFKVPEL